MYLGHKRSYSSSHFTKYNFESNNLSRLSIITYYGVGRWGLRSNRGILAHPLISAHFAIGREHSCLNADWSRACTANASPREMPRMHRIPALDLGL